VTLVSARSPREAADGLAAVQARVAFWFTIALVTLLFLASSAPSPMYIVYQARWHFSSTVLTGLFSIYSLTVMLALVLLGHISDGVGRRRVLICGLLITSLGLVLFASARNVGWIFAARAVQGLGVGISSTTLAALALEVQPGRSLPSAAMATTIAGGVGMAIGSLLAGVFLQYVFNPTVSLYVLLLGLFFGGLVACRCLPQTVSYPRGSRTFWPPRIAVPRTAYRPFALYSAGSMVTWAVGGVYLALGPSIAAVLLHSGNHVIGGLVVFELGAGGTLGALVSSRRSSRSLITVGALLIVLGMGVVVASVLHPSVPLFFAGSAVLALGWGQTNIGSFRALVALARPGRRAEMLAAIYLVLYLAFSIPVLLVGVATDHIGFKTTTVVFGACACLVAAAVGVGMLIFGPGVARREALAQVSEPHAMCG
jgi:MFS family permease